MTSLVGKSSLPQPWSNVYGLARSILALGTLFTLLFNDSATLFRPAGVNIATSLGAPLPLRFGLFALLNYSPLAHGVAIAVMVIVASGWRPRVTGVLHWWVSYSFAAACVPLDGGDQITAVLTLIIVPVTLTDTRRWHWDAPPELANTLRGGVGALVAWSCVLVSRLQVAGVYFHASTGKLDVREWANGTAAYYWITDPSIGAPQWLQLALGPVFGSPFAVVGMTWGTILIEVLLFGALFMRRRWWLPCLMAGLSFHFVILLVHGLVSFFFAMTGALLLYLRPCDTPLALPLWFCRWLRLRSRAPHSALSGGSVTFWYVEGRGGSAKS